MSDSPLYRDGNGIPLQLGDLVKCCGYNREVLIGRVEKFECIIRVDEEVWREMTMVNTLKIGFTWRRPHFLIKLTNEEAMLWRLENPTLKFQDIPL